MTIETLVANLRGSRVRQATLEGRTWLVAPMVMMAEGVLKGNSGPLYYPKEEIAKTPAAWDHKPIVVYHPERGGKRVSACSPEMLDKHKIGMILNTRWDAKSGKLKAEAWLDPERIKEVDPRVEQAISAERVMELSTGLFTDMIPTEGTFRGKAYTAIACNFRPDHLALLPDIDGAYSVAEGAGFLRVNQACDLLCDRAIARAEKVLTKAGLSTTDQTRRALRNIVSNTLQRGLKHMPKRLTKAQRVDALIANSATQFEKKDRAWLMTLDESKLAKMQPVTNADQDDEDPDGQGKPKVGPPLVPDGGEPGENKDNEMTKDLKPGQAQEDQEESDTDNPQPSQKYSDTQPGGSKKPVKGKQQGKADQGDAGKGGKTPTGNSAGRQRAMTEDEYIAAAPPGIREGLQEMRDLRLREKEHLIGQITANSACPFDEDYLDQINDLNHLRGLAALATNGQAQDAELEQVMPRSRPSWAGAAGFMEPVGNSRAQEALEPPTYDFSRKTG